MTERVLHVAPSMDVAAGGPPVVVSSLVRHAAQHGYEASVLTVQSSAWELGEGWPSAPANTFAVPSQLRAISGTSHRQVRAAVEQADVIHLHTMWSPLVASAARAASSAGIPYVLSPHGMLDPWSVSQKALKKRLYWRLVERSVVEGAASLVFTSDAERDLAYGVSGRTILSRVIPLGADAPPTSRADLAAGFFAQHPELAGHPLLVYLGRLHSKKRPEAIIDAMPQLLAAVPDARAVFVGAGDERTTGSLHARVKGLGVAHAVSFLGQLTGLAKWQTIAAATAFVLPSRQENFAIAVAEALRTGVPVLITRSIHIWQEIKAADCGIILDEDALSTSIAAALTRLVADPALAASMSMNATALAEKSFTWDRCAQAMHALYDDILR